MKITTTNCSKYNHPEIELYFDDSYIVNRDIEWYLNLLESNVKSGTIYKPEQIIQIGCMVNKVMSSTPKTIKLQEPDLKEFPVNFIDSVTNTLKILRLQKDIVSSVHSYDLMSFTSIMQSCIICNSNSDGIDDGTVLHRVEVDEAEPLDSGWFIGCLDQTHDHNDPNNLVRTSLYSVFLDFPNYIKFFALPAGTYIEIADGIINKWMYNNKKVKAKKGSLLDVGSDILNL